MLCHLQTHFSTLVGLRSAPSALRRGPQAVLLAVAVPSSSSLVTTPLLSLSFSVVTRLVHDPIHAWENDAYQMLGKIIWNLVPCRMPANFKASFPKWADSQDVFVA